VIEHPTETVAYRYTHDQARDMLIGQLIVQRGSRSLEEWFFLTRMIRRYQLERPFKSQFVKLFFKMIKTRAAFNGH